MKKKSTQPPKKATGQGMYEKEKYEPPTGEGWQVWETVSEGSPVTPVFATAPELVDFLVTRKGYSYEAASNFCKDGGWVPSAIITNSGEYVQDIETARLSR